MVRQHTSLDPNSTPMLVSLRPLYTMYSLDSTHNMLPARGFEGTGSATVCSTAVTCHKVHCSGRDMAAAKVHCTGRGMAAAAAGRH
jgi:hypothetical protein